jgi:16S rRNA (cytosine1402-N4)-methyltransferase
MQLNGCDRGFSFQIDGPLDMRMEDKGETAADIIKHCDESTLANIIYMFGEERKARRIARAIIRNREIKNISSTLQLAEIVRSAVGYSKNKKIDPATRTFQALRIKVNNELDEIYKALIAAEKLLTPGARLVIISFHSLEDKIVKSFFKEKSGKYSNPSRHTVLPHEELHYPLPVAAPLNPLNGLRLEDTKNDKVSFRVINKKVIKASRNEISQNPRSRSARLRAAERLDNRMEYAA